MIQGNRIGFLPDGTPGPGGGNGISVEDSTNTVIGNDNLPGELGIVQKNPQLGNVISNGAGEAIDLRGGSTGTIVAGNFIGVDRDGTLTNPNADGIAVFGSSGNQSDPGTRSPMRPTTALPSSAARPALQRGTGSWRTRSMAAATSASSSRTRTTAFQRP